MSSPGQEVVTNFGGEMCKLRWQCLATKLVEADVCALSTVACCQRCCCCCR